MLRNAGVLLAASLLSTLLFFVGPALGTQTMRRPLMSISQNSLGTLPAFGLRICCACFLAFWIAELLSTPASWFLQVVLRRQFSASESALVAGGILAFALVTGLQTPAINARLALFTNKLGVAILLAALVRVRDGWSAISKGFPFSKSESLISSEWHCLAIVTFFVAPLCFLAADFGYRSRDRKQVAAIAALGLLLPLFGTLFVVGVTDVATSASAAYQPSLSPSVAMALWAHVASSALPGRLMLAAITIFGAMRFGVRVLATSTLGLASRGLGRWTVIGCILLVVAWLSTQYRAILLVPFEWSVTGLAVASAVLTADFATSRWRIERIRRIDWVGTTALMMGWTAVLYLPKSVVGAGADQWWHPGLLPSYAVGFLVCLIGRAIQKHAATLTKAVLGD